jgi:flagellar biogenesis protein FliO
MMFYHFAATPSFIGTDAEMLYLWIRVIAFIGILGGSAYFLSIYTKKKRTRLSTNTKGKIVVADTCSLGNRQFLMVAQYGDEKHLLGVSSSSINHLAKLEIVSEEIKHQKQVLPSDEINANA